MPSRTTTGPLNQTPSLFTAGPAMIDGLYQVETNYLCAAFSVEGGEVVRCAPILRNKLDYWKTIARRIRPPTESQRTSDGQGSDEEI